MARKLPPHPIEMKEVFKKRSEKLWQDTLDQKGGRKGMLEVIQCFTCAWVMGEGKKRDVTKGGGGGGPGPSRRTESEGEKETKCKPDLWRARKNTKWFPVDNVMGLKRGKWEEHENERKDIPVLSGSRSLMRFSWNDSVIQEGTHKEKSEIRSLRGIMLSYVQKKGRKLGELYLVMVSFHPIGDSKLLERLGLGDGNAKRRRGKIREREAFGRCESRR